MILLPWRAARRLASRIYARSEQRGNSGRGEEAARAATPEGRVGKPGGRPAGLSALIRTETKDGKKLVVFCLKVFRDERMRLPFRMWTP
jgi:hypothetical protein